jgi:hypothetical protein
MKKHEELVIITKTYDLIVWSCNHTGRFPRQHRFVLGERLERSLYDLLETLIQAKYSRERTPLLNDANLKLEILRFQMRLAKDLECLQVKSYAFAAKQIGQQFRNLFSSPDRFELVKANAINEFRNGSTGYAESVSIPGRFSSVLVKYSLSNSLLFPVSEVIQISSQIF